MIHENLDYQLLGLARIVYHITNHMRFLENVQTITMYFDHKFISLFT